MTIGRSALGQKQTCVPQKVMSACPQKQTVRCAKRNMCVLGNRTWLGVLDFRRRSAAMPALTFLAAVGLALIALLFVADATLEPGSPAIVTSQSIGLPSPQYHNVIRTLTNTARARARYDIASCARCTTQVDPRHIPRGACCTGQGATRS